MKKDKKERNEKERKWRINQKNGRSEITVKKEFKR